MSTTQEGMTVEHEIELVKQDFIFNLRLLRASVNLSGVELSLKLGMSDKRISDLEGGRMPPTIDDLVRIIDFFEIRFDDLLDCRIGLKIPSQQTTHQ